MDLVSGKVALVTGSGAGIGRAVALKFAEEGANVIVSDVDVDGGNETVAIAKHNGGKVSEIAAPTLPQPLMLLGDLSRLRVRAELDEHDVGKIALGDEVVVHANAFRGREFTGKVAAIAPIVQLGRISSPDSRNLTDFNVNEILIDLDDPGSLLVGMKVDVYIRPRP